MIKLIAYIFLLIAALVTTSDASVFLPHARVVDTQSSSLLSPLSSKAKKELRLNLHRSKRSYAAGASTAMMIPGYGVAEQVFVGGFSNFLSAYNLVITARVLLSWFPQAQGVAVLQPIFSITDPYLNLFRGLVPPIFGLDLSPLLAFFLLNVLTSATAAVGAEIPDGFKHKDTIHQSLLRAKRNQLFTKWQQKRQS